MKLADDAGGTENNIPYDIEFLDGIFTHLAIVDNPRYERANIVFNSKTVVQNFDPNQKRDKKGRWTRENYNAEIDKILKGELKSADVIKVVEHPSAPWLKAGLQDAKMFMSVKTYCKATTDKHNVSEETMRNLPDLIDDPLYIFKSSTVPGSYVGVLDDYEEKNGIKKPLIAVVKPEHGKIDVNLIPSVYGKDSDFPYREVFKNNLLYERLDKNKTVSNNIIASIAMETLKPSNNIITDIQEDFNPDMKNNEVDNDKWITIKPHGKDSDDYRKIKLEDGETPKEAIDRVYGKKQGSAQQYSFENKEINLPYSEYKNKWENSGKYYTKGEYNSKDKTIKLYRPWYAEEFENTFDNISLEIKQMEREYEKNKDDSSMREKVEEFKNKQKPKLKSIAQKIILDKLNRSTWNHANRVAYTFLLDELKQNEGLSYYIRRVEGNIAKDFVKNTLNEIFQSDEMKEFYKKNQNIGLSKEEKEKHKKITNSKEQNNKEQDMALIDELKKLVTKVENDKVTCKRSAKRRCV